MKTAPFLQSILFFLVAFALPGSASDALLEKANLYYKERDYSNALKTYEKLLSAENESAELLYNIGNCNYKMGLLGKAILYYERAARIQPDDEDIAFNLRLAGLKAVDRIEPVPPIIYKRWFNSVSNALTVSQWSVVLIVLVWLAFVAWSFYILSGTVIARKTGFAVAAVFSGLCILTFLLLNNTYREANVRQYGVVLSPSSYVKSAPDENGNDQFILHEGTKLEVLDELGEWNKIRIANGSVGWLKKKDFEII